MSKRAVVLALVLAVWSCDTAKPEPDPQPPEACGGLIDDISLYVLESTSVEICFNDESVGTLTYGSQSSESSSVTATSIGKTVELLAVAVGEATITVTATNKDSLSADLSFRVIVPNRNPQSCTDVPDEAIELFIGDTISSPVCFTDPDNHELTYSVGSSNPNVVVAEATDTVITFIGVGLDSATITVTATDTEGGATAVEFSIVIPNRNPVICRALPTEGVLIIPETLAFPVCITDPDGHALSDSIATSNQNVLAELSSGRDTLYVTGLSAGDSYVKLWSTDPYGASAETAMTLTVRDEVTVLSDDFDDDSGNWTDSDSPSGLRGQFEIKDGSLFARWIVEGYGGADHDVSATDWTLSVRARTEDSGTGLWVEAYDGDGVRAYLIIIEAHRRTGVHRIRFDVFDARIGRWGGYRDEWSKNIPTNIANYEWLNIGITTAGGRMVFSLNDAELYVLSDEEAVFSRISKISLNAVMFESDAQHPAEFDYVRIRGARGSQGEGEGK